MRSKCKETVKCKSSSVEILVMAVTFSVTLAGELRDSKKRKCRKADSESDSNPAQSVLNIIERNVIAHTAHDTEY